MTFEEAYNELVTTFPKSVLDKFGGRRRLHGQPERCERLYKNIICFAGVVDDELHKKIILCLKKEIQERKKGFSLAFFQMMSTWLHQKSYRLYLEDVEKDLSLQDKGISPISEDFEEDRL